MKEQHEVYMKAILRYSKGNMWKRDKNCGLWVLRYPI